MDKLQKNVLVFSSGVCELIEVKWRPVRQEMANKVDTF